MSLANAPVDSTSASTVAPATVSPPNMSPVSTPTGPVATTSPVTSTATTTGALPHSSTSTKKTTSQASQKSLLLGKNAPRVAKSKLYRKIPKGDCKNNKGWAEGKHEELLRKMVPSFVKECKEGWHAEAQKLLDIQNCYHNHFPYPMWDTDEPADMVFDVNMTKLSIPPTLSEEESQKRLKYIKEYSKCVGVIMKCLAKAEEGDPGTSRRKDADIVIGKIVSALDCTKKCARSAAQHWMHENWFTGLELCDVMEAKWAERADQTLLVQPLVFRMTQAAEMFKELPAEEQERWKKSAKEEASKMEKEMDDDACGVNPVDIASVASAAPGLLFRVARAVEERSSTRIFSMMAGPMAAFDGDIGFLIIDGEKNKAAVPQTFPEFIGNEKTKELRELYKAWVLTCFSEEDKKAVIIQDPSAYDREQLFEQITVPPMRELTPKEKEHSIQRAKVVVRARNYLYDQGRHVPDSDEVAYQTGLLLIESGEMSEIGGKDAPAVYHRDGSARDAEGSELKPAPLPSNPPPRPRSRCSTPTSNDNPPAPLTPDPLPVLRLSSPESNLIPRAPSTPTLLPFPRPATPVSEASPPLGPSTLARCVTPEPLATDPVPRPVSNFILPSPTPLPTLGTKRRASLSLDRSSKRVTRSADASTALAPNKVTGTLPEESVENVKEEVAKETGGPLAWTVTCCTEFTSVPNGELMAPLLLRLLKLERSFVTKGMKPTAKRSIPGLHCPSTVATWITAGRCDRKAGQNLDIAKGNLVKFKEDVQRWWNAMQPSWRVKDATGRWKADSYGGEWTQLVCPGRNGMLSVIATLSWWGRKVSIENETAEWMLMVDDVKWVLDGLIAGLGL